MTGTGRRDHSTFTQKAAVRRLAVELVKDPVVLETHGGTGRLFMACYRDVPRGIVFERDGQKAAILARQRPSWSVYEGECERGLRAGLGGHLEVNLLDLDPWGDPWPAIRGFFQSDRPRAARLAIAVNDGLRQKVRLGGAWHTSTLKEAVVHFGNRLDGKYLEVCRWLLGQVVEPVGYTVSQFGGYYCGSAGIMTHYLALLELNGNGSGDRRPAGPRRGSRAGAVKSGKAA